MPKDTVGTRVIFRNVKYPDGEKEILALFPYQQWTNVGRSTVASYAHKGQHGPAEYHHILSISKLAKPDEYGPLKKELESIGYDLRVIKKWTR